MRAAADATRLQTRNRIMGISARRIVLYVVVFALTIIFTIPSYWTAIGSLKSYGEVVAIPPLWWPTELRWGNYARVMELIPYVRFFENTLLVSLIACFGQVTSASLVGYGFARFRFVGRDILFMLVLSTIMLPPELTLIPTFILFKLLGWFDTYLPLIVPSFFGGGAFFVFLFRQFFMTIPKDLDEAARIDGAGHLRIFWSIVAPLSLPAFAAATITSFLTHWNDFINPLIYLNTLEKFTLSIGITAFKIGSAGGAVYEPRDQLLMAATVMMTVPILIIFFVAQRYFIQGIVMSGIKG
jgi:multiple sugar transport system permease protein